MKPIGNGANGVVLQVFKNNVKAVMKVSDRDACD